MVRKGSWSLAVLACMVMLVGCNTIAGMGKDVHAALLQIVSEQAGVDAEGAAEYLSKLQAEGRYSRDVY